MAFPLERPIAGGRCKLYNVTSGYVLRRRIDVGQGREGSGDKRRNKKIDAEAKSKQEVSRRLHETSRGGGDSLRGLWYGFRIIRWRDQ